MVVSVGPYTFLMLRLLAIRGTKLGRNASPPTYPHKSSQMHTSEIANSNKDSVIDVKEIE